MACPGRAATVLLVWLSRPLSVGPVLECSGLDAPDSRRSAQLGADAGFCLARGGQVSWSVPSDAVGRGQCGPAGALPAQLGRPEVWRKQLILNQQMWIKLRTKATTVRETERVWMRRRKGGRGQRMGPGVTART